MMITIDLGGDEEGLIVDGNEKKKEDVEALRRSEEERKLAWIEWVRYNEQVVPQVVPVEQT